MGPTWAERLRHCQLTKRDLRRLGEELPADGAALETLLEQTIESGTDHEVTALLLAAAGAGRPIAARFLGPAVDRMLDALDLPGVVLHATGDVLQVCLAKAQDPSVAPDRQALLLLLAAWIHKTRQPDLPVPQELVVQARMLARQYSRIDSIMLTLYSVDRLLEVEVLRHALEGLCPPPPSELVDLHLELVMEASARDPLDMLPESGPVVRYSGAPLRRSVPKVGRNDPCPCGSGKKYKRCCFEKDQERLRHSSEVAGITEEELEAAPEPHLTSRMLEEMPPHKLARLHAGRVPKSLHAMLLERLAMFGLWDAMTKAWDQIGWRDELIRAWVYGLTLCVKAQQADVADRLIALRGLRQDDPSIPLGARLLFERDRPEAFFGLIEAEARKHADPPESPLDAREAYRPVEMAEALLNGPYPGLGMLVMRGLLVTADFLQALALSKSLLAARDRLNLSPQDPSEWLLDQFTLDKMKTSAGSRAELEEYQHKFEAAQVETERLQRELNEVRTQLERQERLARQRESKEQEKTTAPPQPDATDAVLRQRIAELKQALKERHQERNELRRKLSEVLSAHESPVETKPPASAPAEQTLDLEESSFCADEAPATYPPRLPVFPDRFDRAWSSLPDHVVRAALATIGRLAAGEPSAFAGMRRLRTDRELCRVRIGADHRLLFRLKPDRLEVVDLINRRDLDRRLKALV